MYCRCGCGGLAPIAKWTDRHHGWVKGEPKQYMKGHNTRGKPLGSEHCAKLSAAKLGEFNPNWQGGITAQNKAARNTPEYKRWIKDVKARDDYACQECGSTELLHAHHIMPLSLHPELIVVLSNGVTLCKGCHEDVHAEMRTHV